MNRLSTIFAVLGISTLATCCKIGEAIVDASGPLPRLANWGYLTAELNGTDWHKTYKNAYQVTHGVINYLDEPQDVSYYLISIIYNEAGAKRQELVFQNIPFSPRTGRHQLISCDSYAGCESSDKPQAALFELLSDGDVAGDSFYTVDSEENYIQIDSFNETTNEIRGSFQLTLANVRIPRSSNKLPDTLRFRNGRFHTKIIAYKRRDG